MKLSYRMLSDLEVLSTPISQLYEEYYVKDNGYTYENEIDYQDMYNAFLNAFDNGYLTERNIEFEFGKSEIVDLFSYLKHSAKAILYYPDRVTYHNEYRLIFLGNEFIFSSLNEVNNKISQILQEEIDAATLYERYSVHEIIVETVDDQRTVTFLPDLDKNNLKDDSYYLINAFDGQRIEVYGKDQLISTLEIERQREADNLSEVMIVEQKIEDTVDHFTAWMSV